MPDLEGRAREVVRQGRHGALEVQHDGPAVVEVGEEGVVLRLVRAHHQPLQHHGQHEQPDLDREEGGEPDHPVLAHLRGPRSTVRTVLLRTSTIIGYYIIEQAIIGYNIAIIGYYRLL